MANNWALRALFSAARASVAGHYGPRPLRGPLDMSRDASILIQWSDTDCAWIASLIDAERPILLGRVNADGLTPMSALRNLDDLLAVASSDL